MARASIVGATILASITSSTAVVGLDPAEIPAAGPVTVVTAPTSTTNAPPDASVPEPVPVGEITIPGLECREPSANFCVEMPSAAPASQTTENLSGCTTPGAHSPTGTIETVPASTSPDADSIRVRVEVESGLAIDPGCFAAEVFDVLNDDRGWSSVHGVHFSHADDDAYDLRLILASPATTDSLCYPARTAGIYSCRNGDRVVINLMRWESGSDDYSNDLTTYRQYLLNHEVGHFLGHGHEECPGTGEQAPVMMQQTKGLRGCLPNGWPAAGEQ